jgi:U3 small nucleolar RNA-associated protein 22
VGVDAVMAANEQWKVECLETMKALTEGIMMLKVWLKQRGLGEGHGAFSGYIMTMYVAHLVKARKLSAVMSSYQVVRNTWHNLGEDPCFNLKNLVNKYILDSS